MAVCASLVACQLAPPLVKPSYEGTISADAYGNVRLNVAGRSFVLKTLDGKPLGDLVIRAGGEAHPVRGGKFHLPASALENAKRNGGGFFWVFAQGYTPKQVWLGQPDETIQLAPLFSLFVKPAVPKTGGLLETADKRLKVSLPPNLLTKEQTNVALSGYVPPVTQEDQQRFDERRSSLLAKVKSSGYRVLTHPECVEPEQPLPCHIEKSLGLLLTIDGPVQPPSTVTVNYDLKLLLHGWDGTTHPAPWHSDPSWTTLQIAEAEAAARILRTFAQIDAHAQAATFRQVLEADYGITLNQQLLTFSVPLTTNASYENGVSVQVAGFDLLGVKLEVTIVSSTSSLSPLPASASTPGLVALNPTQLVGGGLISNNGGAVVSNNGGGLISNNGGALTGHIRVPFAPGAAMGDRGKYRLLAYTDYPWPNAVQVRATNALGAPWSGWVTNDAASNYLLASLPPTERFVFLEGAATPYRLRALAPAPGSSQVKADMNAATTAITCWVIDEIQKGNQRVETLNHAGYGIDVSKLVMLLSQAEAEWAVLNSIPDVATRVRNLFATNSVIPASFSYTVSTLAGNGTGGYADGVGTGAMVKTPYSLAAAPDGTVYVADSGNHRIRKIAPDGTVTTLAGSGAVGNADGTGTAASFWSPLGIALDGAGNVFVADEDNHAIRRITPAGVVTTVAGGLQGWVDGNAASARFNRPQGLVVDGAGNIFVCDSDNQRIRKIDASGNVTTIAGAGTVGKADGAGAIAQFNNPTAIAVDSFGNLFVADSGNSRVRKIAPDGTVSTFAGSAAGYADGTGTAARFAYASGIAIDGANNLYLADQSNFMVRRITPTGVVTTLAGNGTLGYADGVGPAALFNRPKGVAVDGAGVVYVADQTHHRIRKLAPGGTAPALAPGTTTFVGSGTAGSADGAGTAAALNGPFSLAFAGDGSLYVADTDNQRIRKIDAAGNVTTFAGSTAGFTNATGAAAQFDAPLDVAVDGAGNVYVADQMNHAIRKISPAGAVTTLAGNGTAGYADGAGAAAQFNRPHGLVLDAIGNIYVADRSNQRIRRIDAAGNVTTVAGSGTIGSANGVGVAAQFANPTAIARDSLGNLFVADTDNHQIRKIDPAGVVTTFAGSSTAGFADGTGTAARFNLPCGIDVDGANNLYVGDLMNHVVRKITPAGVVTTLAGTGAAGYVDGPNAAAQFNFLKGVAVDGAGAVYVADQLNHRIRRVVPGP